MTSTVPSPVRTWLNEQGFVKDIKLASLAGGDINETFTLTVAGEQRFCIKFNRRCPPDFFRAEAAGLNAIAACQRLRTPTVVHVDKQFLVLEFIESGYKNNDYWNHFAALLAQMHQQPQPCFGFDFDNFCGRTPQPNPHYDDGFAFFREQRIHFQARMAFECQRLDKTGLVALERFAEKLEQLIPLQAPALLHGDLWYGNMMVDTDGEPVVIDPATYWGWPEADLAMTSLFGGVPAEFYRHYQRVRPMEPGWQQRFDIYNVYHLLNHLNLFGGGYYPQVMRIIKRYA